jgi:hypothetical protein
MFEELLALKAEAEHEMVYAQAKLEIVDKLLAKVKPVDEPAEEVVADYAETEDVELGTV